MATGDQFGASVGPWYLEQAVLSLLQTPPQGSTFPLIQYYIADQERQLGLAARSLPVPPGTSSYIGGVDSRTFQAEWFPAFHVTVHPIEEVTRIDMTSWGQRWRIVVTATDGRDDEALARRNSGSLATAAALLLAQHGSLNAGATQTFVHRMPDTTLLDPIDTRQVTRTLFEVDTFTPIALTTGGPTTFPASPYSSPGQWTQATSVNVTVTGKQIS